MKGRAREEVRKVLKEHNPQYISEDMKQEIDKVAREAQKEVLERDK